MKNAFEHVISNIIMQMTFNNNKNDMFDVQYLSKHHDTISQKEWRNALYTMSFINFLCNQKQVPTELLVKIKDHLTKKDWDIILKKRTFDETVLKEIKENINWFSILTSSKYDNLSLDLLEQVSDNFTDLAWNNIYTNNNVNAEFFRKHKDKISNNAFTAVLLRNMTTPESDRYNPIIDKDFFEGKNVKGFDLDFVREFKNRINWYGSNGYDMRAIFKKCPKEFKEQFQEIYDAKIDEDNKKREQDNRAWSSVMSSVPPDATGLD